MCILRATRLNNKSSFGKSVRLVAANINAQVAQLPGVDRAGGVCHQVSGPLRLGKGDAIANIIEPAEKHHPSIDSQCNSAVRRRSVRERVQQEAESLALL